MGLIALVLLVLVIFFSKYYEGPRLSPVVCIGCTEWENDICGGGSCALNEMQQVRVCELDDPGEVFPVKDGPQLSPSPEDCFSRCILIAECNSLPLLSNLNPPSEGLDIEIESVILNWDANDPDEEILLFDVYFGTETDPVDLVAEGIEVFSYSIDYTLNYDTDYYWQIIANDNFGETIGSVWSFRTEVENLPPNEPINPSPMDEAIDVVLSPTLSWFADDPNEDSLTYNVYFGAETDPELVSSDQIESTYLVGMLNYGTIYYWRVELSDGGNLVSSSEFIFTTEEQAVAQGDTSGDGDFNECAPGCRSFWLGNGDCDVVCNVTECNYDKGDCEDEGYVLFDIKVFLREEYPKLMAGSDVTADIVLYNFGTIRPVDVYLVCTIEDLSEDRNKLDFFSETLAVAVQTTIDRNLRVPEGTEPGRYVYNCYMTYAANQEPISSGDLFEIIVPVELPEERVVGVDYTVIVCEFLLSNWIWFVIGIVILLIIIIIKKKKKKKSLI